MHIFQLHNIVTVLQWISTQLYSNINVSCFSYFKTIFGNIFSDVRFTYKSEIARGWYFLLYFRTEKNFSKCQAVRYTVNVAIYWKLCTI